MLSFLRSNNPIYFFFSAAILPVIATIHYLNSSELNWPIEAFFRLNKTALYTLYVFTVFFTALRINLIINKSVFFQKSNYASGLIYIVLIGFSGNIQSSLNPLLGNLFVVLALENLFKIRDPIYSSISDYIIETSGKRANEISSEIESMTKKL